MIEKIIKFLEDEQTEFSEEYLFYSNKNLDSEKEYLNNKIIEIDEMIKYLKNNILVDVICPQCQNRGLSFKEGDLLCQNCGFIMCD